MSTVFKVSAIRKAPENLIIKMKSIVEDVITNSKFKSDFDNNDLFILDQKPGIYAWYVYDCGTHLMALNDFKAVLEFQREWIEGMKDLEGKKPSKLDRLYVLNVQTGDIRRVIGFKDEKNLVKRLLETAV